MEVGMIRRLSLLLVVVLLGVLAISCSGGQDPIAGSTVELQETPKKSALSTCNPTALLGYYDINFDIASESFEIVSNRNADFTLNIVAFLNQMTIPMNGITFDQIVIHNDDPSFIGVDVEFSIHHPFPGYDQYQAYDLRGVVIGNGAEILEYGNLRTSLHGTDLWMKNPDGYTRWFNPTEFTSELIFGYTPGGFQNLAGDANLNPYKYYGKHLDWDGNLWSWLTEGPNFDGMFESGTGRKMELEFPMPPDGIGLMFGYAVVVAWEEQGPTGPYTPYHIPEAVAASVTQTPDVWYNGVDSGGELILDIDLFAWEQQPSTIKIESSVLDGIAEFDAAVYGSPAGDHVSTYHVEAVATTLGTTEGHEYWVIAEYDGYDYSNGLPDIPHTEGSLAAFFRFDCQVLHESPENPSITVTIPNGGETLYVGAPYDIEWTSNLITGNVKIEYSPDGGVSWPTVIAADTPDDWTESWVPQTGDIADNLGLIRISSIDDPLVFDISDATFSVVKELSVTGIDPDTVPFWSVVDDAEISGLSFENGATVELRKDGESPVSGTGVVWMSETLIQCDFDLQGVDSGSWDVVVINPDMLEGVLEDGLTIDIWSEETVIETGNYRLPALEEMMSGPIVLAAGRNDSTMRYMTWDPTVSIWEGPYLLDNNPGNNLIIPLASDPNDDKIFCFATSHKFYRYTGGTGEWEEAYHPVNGNRTAVITVDFNSRLHFINNTASAFGWILHFRTSIWPPQSNADYDILFDYFPNAVNSLYLTEGNCIAYNSSGDMYVAYNKDNSLSPYLGYPPAGPRYIRVTPLPGGGSSSGYWTIEQVTGEGIALDSPALTIDPDNNLHAAYRIWDVANSEWQIRYEQSTNGGASWSPGANIRESSTEPVKGYIYLYSDSQGVLHSVCCVDEFFEYRNSNDGSSWSAVELADSDKPTSDDDFMPKAYVTSDDIMHFAWIRGDKSSGYGDVCHRMRDLN